MKKTVFDFLTDLSYIKSDILNEDTESDYSPYIVNRFLSMDVTTVMYANEINLRSNLTKRMQYDYYINSITKQKRYFKYVKTKKELHLDAIKEYFGYGDKKAKEVLRILTKDEIDYIMHKLTKGGADAKKR